MRLASVDRPQTDIQLELQTAHIHQWSVAGTHICKADKTLRLTQLENSCP